MIALAAVRPDDWNVALFIHVLGAFTLIGALVVAASFLFAARHEGSHALTRAGFRSLLIVALPAFIATRVGGERIASKEGLKDADLTWITVGCSSTDGGLLVLLGATLVAGLAVRRAARAEAGGVRGRGAAFAAWLVTLLIAVYATVIVVMATKPA
jgi:hypothetical protein